MTASLDGQVVSNGEVYFTNTAEFERALAAFERTREGVAFLDGTEGCRIAIEPDGRAGHAWLDLQVARTLASSSPQTGRTRSGRITVAGGFAVAGDLVGQMVRDFARLFAPGDAR